MDDSYHKTSFHFVPEAMRTQKKGLFTRNIFSLESANKHTNKNQWDRVPQGSFSFCKVSLHSVKDLDLPWKRKENIPPPTPPALPLQTKSSLFSDKMVKNGKPHQSVCSLWPSSYLLFLRSVPKALRSVSLLKTFKDAYGMGMGGWGRMQAMILFFPGFSWSFRCTGEPGTIT